MSRALRSPKIVLGLVIVAFFVLMALFGPLLVHTDPSQVSNDSLQAPSGTHWFGTTQTGQDILAQVVDGARNSMLVGFVAGALSTVLSVLVGVTAGYLGRVWDESLSVVANVFLVIPTLPLTVIVAAYLPHTGQVGLILVIALTGWAWGARVLRAQTLSLRKRDFVEAARASGQGSLRIIVSEILPNQTAIIAAAFLGNVVSAILTEAGLAFLGLTDLTQWSWGGILYWAQNGNVLLSGAWWWFVPAGLCIALLGAGLSLVNFGIDEFVNPRLRAVGVNTRRGPRKQRMRPARWDRSKETTVDAALTEALLEIRNVSIDYETDGGAVHAVDDVSLTLRRGEVLGIAGESGSGKSTLAYAITRLLKAPARATGGQIIYTAKDGASVDVLDLTGEELRAFRWDKLSIVFQSAMNALNPVLRVGTQIGDVLSAHRKDLTATARANRVKELLRLVGIPEDRATAYPHELSGGMRQRVMIAIALALDPEVIVLDEPTTALDTVIQREIVSQLSALRGKLGFSVVFITHDLSLLVEMSDTIAVMYAGRVVETGPAEEFYRDPRHPYSKALLQCFPTLSGPRKELTGIPGSPPDLRELPVGCPFQPRCAQAFDGCADHRPVLIPLITTQSPQQVACRLYPAGDDSQLVPEPV
ncbi:MAG TPA: dipeptide/oligopeptide/nickel ABC transporter permease/ATP-binding protein [Pseudonocardiaceae bacterium]|jgi:oligopeptide/dipeptide ABC transporter ATP-binding protein|nr:dipeptide/oligopeptide/nickel ABC transporter permease/ATP-binding protein [Pseudonocardiaceae bacterium]